MERVFRDLVQHLFSELANVHESSVEVFQLRLGDDPGAWGQKEKENDKDPTLLLLSLSSYSFISCCCCCSSSIDLCGGGRSFVLRSLLSPLSYLCKACTVCVVCTYCGSRVGEEDPEPSKASLFPPLGASSLQPPASSSLCHRGGRRAPRPFIP